MATKAVAHPTESHLMVRAIEHLNRAAEDAGLRVRQSYQLVTRHAKREAARLMHGRGHRQAIAHLRYIGTALPHPKCYQGLSADRCGGVSESDLWRGWRAGSAWARGARS